MMDLVNLLAFVTYVSAARSDATAEQVVDLRRDVLPLLDAFQNGLATEREVLDEVSAIMGPGWNPSATWANQLDALGFTRDDTGKV